MIGERGPAAVVFSEYDCRAPLSADTSNDRFWGYRGKRLVTQKL